MMPYHPVRLIMASRPVIVPQDETIEWPVEVRLPVVGDTINYTAENRMLAAGKVTEVVFWMTLGKAVSGDDLDRLVEVQVHLR